jgi:hypothetical protein
MWWSRRWWRASADEKSHPEAAGIATECAQPFCASALHEFQVVRIKHDATRIGVFPIDADGVSESGSRHGQTVADLMKAKKWPEIALRPFFSMDQCG